MERDVRDLDWRDLATSIPLELADVPLDGLEYLGLVVDDLHEGRRLGKGDGSVVNIDSRWLERYSNRS